MTSKFAIGTRVRVLWTEAHAFSGDTGTVVERDKNQPEHYDVTVLLDDWPHTTAFYSVELTAI